MVKKRQDVTIELTEQSMAIWFDLRSIHCNDWNLTYVTVVAQH